MICDVCHYEKQIKNSFKAKNKVFINQAQQLLYMDLFNPMRVSSIGGKRFAFIIINDFGLHGLYSFHAKMKYLKPFESYIKEFKMNKDCLSSKIRSDHGGEFEKLAFNFFL